MTVNTSISERVYTGNGATTSFATGFKILESTDLVVKTRVIATGVEATLVEDTDYSVSDVGEDLGSTVSYPISGAPLAATHQLVLERSVDFLQPDSIRNQSGFFPSVLEDGFDRAVMMIQELASRITRSPQFQVGTTVTDFSLPEPSANKVLGWSGTALANVSQAGIISAEATTLAPGADATAEYDAETGVLTVGVPEGEQGIQGPAGAGTGDMLASANLSDLVSASTARTNLGLGTAALMADSADTDLTVDPDAALRRDIAKSYIDTAVSGSGWTHLDPISLSGTAQDQTGIPSGVTFIEITCDEPSLSGSSSLLFQFGTLADGYVTTGYKGYGNRDSALNVSQTAGMPVALGADALTFIGNIRLRRIKGTNTWISDHGGFTYSTDRASSGGGKITLTSALDRIRLTSVNGTDTFDGGQFCVSYL